MSKLKRADEVWETVAQPRDVQTALDYALVSLPWTFDRMSYGSTTEPSMQKRLANIMIGVLNQTILERNLTSLKIPCKADWTDYRQSDHFDFMIRNQHCDVKTTVVYTDYDNSVGRQKFAPDLLVKNRSNQGPDWRHFFPQMVTLSQFRPSFRKDKYVFGVAVTKRDIRKPVSGMLSKNGIWCAAPFGNASQFFHHRELIKKREAEGKGFRLKIEWRRPQAVINSHTYKIKIHLVGEWMGKRQVRGTTVTPSKPSYPQYQFSSLSSIVVDDPHLLLPNDFIEITPRNKYCENIPKKNDPTINLNNSNFAWKVYCKSLIDLKVGNYKVYWIGHISYDEFMKKFVKYPCYFAPRPNSFKNEEGRLTSKLKEKFDRFDRARDKTISDGAETPVPKFSSLLKKNKINAGILISARRPSGQTLGASCYYYPGFYAFQESAMYVLPRDLEVMDSLGLQEGSS